VFPGMLLDVYLLAVLGHSSYLSCAAVMSDSESQTQESELLYD
jgi:hypothetical protein